MRPAALFRIVAIICLLCAVITRQLQGQDLATAAQDWRSLQTAHFVIHYPRQLDEWTRHTAARLESVHDAVARLVGWAPADRITVVVDDPLNVANGYAMPGPLMFLFPTPPGPRTMIGENRDWGEMLAVHELAHLLHFGRPSRKPFGSFLRSLLPVQTGPILQAPRWVHEGYATYVEGKLTGAGRPHGVWRPTVLRQFALFGRLPRYEELNSTEGFHRGAMAYLAGSAFIEWLVEKEGEESLVNLWRRMTARTTRTFGSAFVGVYGASPAELYGRFYAEVTASAFAVEREVEKSGRAEGELFQRFSWYIGDPSLSANGRHLVVAVQSRFEPTRVVVYDTRDDTLTDAARRTAERAQRRDPEDVPPVSRGPRPHRQLAVLTSPAGQPYDSPRFTRDGSRILLTRLEALGDGSVRPDLFEWRWQQNSLRRITRAAGVRHPDPAPSGVWAAASQCIHGYCSVVRIALADGSLTVLARGTPERNYYRPRVSPDGNSIVASMQDGWRWTLVRIDANSGNVTSLGLDDSHSRFDAEFTGDGNGMVAVSSAGGIFNLEFVDPASRSSRRITNVAGAAFAPAITPGGDSAYFVALRADGYEIRRISLLSSAATPLLTDLSLTPAVTLRPRQLAQLDTLDPGPDKPYGFGPQRPFWLPLGGSDAQGAFGGALFSLADPVGRLGAVLTATAGNVDAWRGVSLKSEWRGWPVQFGAQLHLTGKRFHVVDAPVSSPFELRYSGAQLAAQRELNFINRGVTLSTGVWAGALEQPGQPSQSRTLGFVNLSAGAVGQSGAVTFAGNFSSNFEAGSTAGENWNRLQLSLATAVRSPGPDLSAFISAGLGSADGAPMEQYLIGGDVSPHLDPRSSSNFVAAPVLRNALLAGDRYLKARAELAQFLPTTFYGEWVWPGGNAGYFATVGTFVDIEAPRLPQLALPSITGELGIGIVVAGPHARRAATYLMLRARP